jgi:hypothetical protein
MNIVKEKSTEFGIMIHSICTGDKTKGSLNIINQFLWIKFLYIKVN